MGITGRGGGGWSLANSPASQAKKASIGKILGPSFSREAMPDVMDTLLNTYVSLREEEETFLQTYQRVGIEPFKERVYASPAA